MMEKSVSEDVWAWFYIFILESDGILTHSVSTSLKMRVETETRRPSDSAKGCRRPRRHPCPSEEHPLRNLSDEEFSSMKREKDVPEPDGD